jgi:hypothetical protein
MDNVGASDSRLPAWAGPPDNMIPGAVPYEAVMAASSDAVIWISVLWAFPVGFQFTLSISTREARARRHYASGPFFLPERNPETGEQEWGPGEQFHFAVHFPDGRVADNRAHIQTAPPAPDDPPPEAGIELRSGRMGLSEQWSETTYWLWPLPPPGRIGFICAWPAMGIGRTLVEVDSRVIREAAARAVELWPHLPAS